MSSFETFKSFRIGRRGFIGLTIALFLSLVGFISGRRRRPIPGMKLPPPGALPEKQFLEACARCFKCGNACPNDCIEYHGLEAGLEKAFTPYIHARSRGCILCGKCGEACPTGALAPIGDSKDSWVENVKMGTARVNKDMCYSYHGRTCGACYRACPLPNIAMSIGLFETPIVHPDSCVGCGLCEQACLHLPQAIRVIPSKKGKRLLVL